MSKSEKYYIIMLLSVSVFPMLGFGIFFIFNLQEIGILITCIMMIPIWLLCSNKMEKAEIDNYNMEIKKDSESKK